MRSRRVHGQCSVRYVLWLPLPPGSNPTDEHAVKSSITNKLLSVSIPRAPVFGCMQAATPTRLVMTCMLEHLQPDVETHRRLYSADTETDINHQICDIHGWLCPFL